MADWTLPEVIFIEGEPPPSDKRRRSRAGQSESPVIVGALRTKPGVWAQIESGRPGAQVAHKLRQYAEANDIPVEARCAQGVAYARWVDDLTTVR